MPFKFWTGYTSSGRTPRDRFASASPIPVAAEATETKAALGMEEKAETAGIVAGIVDMEAEIIAAAKVAGIMVGMAKTKEAGIVAGIANGIVVKAKVVDITIRAAQVVRVMIADTLILTIEATIMAVTIIVVVILHLPAMTEVTIIVVLSPRLPVMTEVTMIVVAIPHLQAMIEFPTEVMVLMIVLVPMIGVARIEDMVDPPLNEDMVIPRLIEATAIPSLNEVMVMLALLIDTITIAVEVAETTTTVGLIKMTRVQRARSFMLQTCPRTSQKTPWNTSSRIMGVSRKYTSCMVDLKLVKPAHLFCTSPSARRQLL